MSRGPPWNRGRARRQAGGTVAPCASHRLPSTAASRSPRRPPRHPRPAGDGLSRVGPVHAGSCAAEPARCFSPPLLRPRPGSPSRLQYTDDRPCCRRDNPLTSPCAVASGSGLAGIPTVRPDRPPRVACSTSAVETTSPGRIAPARQAPPRQAPARPAPPPPAPQRQAPSRPAPVAASAQSLDASRPVVPAPAPLTQRRPGTSWPGSDADPRQPVPHRNSPRDAARFTAFAVRGSCRADSCVHGQHAGRRPVAGGTLTPHPARDDDGSAPVVKPRRRRHPATHQFLTHSSRAGSKSTPRELAASASTTLPGRHPPMKAGPLPSDYSKKPRPSSPAPAFHAANRCLISSPAQ